MGDRLKIAFQRFTFPVPFFRPDSSNGRTQLVCPYEVNSCKLVVSFDKSFFAVEVEGSSPSRGTNN